MSRLLPAVSPSLLSAQDKPAPLSAVGAALAVSVCRSVQPGQRPALTPVPGDVQCNLRTQHAHVCAPGPVEQQSCA